MTEENLPSKKFQARQRLISFRYAFHGLKMIITTQHNMWIHLIIAGIVVITGFLLKISATDWVIITILIGFVLSAEAFNTAIEFLTDLVSPEFNPKAGLVKDVAAAAVLIAAVTAVISGILVFWKYL